MLSQSPEILHPQQAYAAVTDQVQCPGNRGGRWPPFRDSWASNIFLHKGKEEGDSCWRISRLWDGGTHLPCWPEVLGDLLLTRCLGWGCCGESAEACLSFGLSPSAARLSEHRWYYQGRSEHTKNGHKALGKGGVYGPPCVFCLWRWKAWGGVWWILWVKIWLCSWHLWKGFGFSSHGNLRAEDCWERVRSTQLSGARPSLPRGWKTWWREL